MNTENNYQETDLGNVAPNPRGEFSEAEEYEYLDYVFYQGGSYLCLAELGTTIAGFPPEAGKTTKYWQAVALPGGLTPEYIAMHDRVANLSEQVSADTEEVRESKENIEGMETNVESMQAQVAENAQATEASKTQAAGYASAAEVSRQAAETSEQNINAQVTGFDTHVSEKTESAEADIEAARIAANAAVVAQQESSVQEVKNKTSQYITEKQTEAEKAIETKAQEYATSVDADIQAVKDAGTTQVGNVNTAGDAQVQNVNTAGTTQIEAVNTAGSAQKKAVEDAGREALNNIGNGVDATLSMEGKAADAAATGKAVDELKGDITELSEPKETEKMIAINPNFESGYFAVSGNYYSSDVYSHTEKIDVQTGDLIWCTASNQTYNYSMRFVTAYSRDFAVKDSGNEGVSEYTVPEGIDSIIISIQRTEDVQYTIHRATVERTIQPKGIAIISKSLDTIKDKVDILYDDSAVILSTSLSSVDASRVIKLADTIDVKKNCAFNYYARFDNEMGTVGIYHGNNKYNSGYVTIDRTNIKIFTHNGSASSILKTVAHGLTITDFVHVYVVINEKSWVTVRVTSVSGTFKTDAITWNGCNGEVMAMASMATMDVRFDYIINDMKKPTYLFGDSYTAVSAERYPWYLISEDSITNFLICGFGGAQSKDEILSFRAMMEIRHPNRVVWALGMNDKDTDDTVNAEWVQYKDEVESYCYANGIELILATIPCVPNRSHVYKNEIVRNSGHRYVDFAAAVNAEAAGSTWYDGMLSADNVHPTELGARVLAARFITDVPEVMIN